MRNNYEAPEVFEFGKAHEVVLGSKPFVEEQVDSIFGLDRQTLREPDDIDEGE